MAKKKDTLVPYDQVSPGFEAAYTGETSATPVRENEMITTLRSDENGNLIRQWPTIPWTFPDKEDGCRKEDKFMKTSDKAKVEVQIIEMTPKDDGKVPLCGHKDPSKECYQHKFQWIKKRMSEGLKVKMLNTPDDGIAGYIEYVPGEHAWRAVNAEGYMFIHCIYIQWKRCKGRGYGTLLIEECVKEAKRADMNGVAVVTREGTWMVGKELFLKNGFEEVEKALPDFSLLVKKFKKSAPTPSFKGQWDKKRKKFGKGLTVCFRQV